MNRGSRLMTSSDGLSTSCFNEAPIHESGKSHYVNSRRKRASGFNEAPIHESGKFGSTVTLSPPHRTLQ